MKATIRYFPLVLVFIMLLILAACSGDASVDMPPDMEVTQSEEPIVTPAETKDVPTPDDTAPPVTAPSLTPLTFHEAMAICDEWIYERPDLVLYAVPEWYYEFDDDWDDEWSEVPPPTYFLFGEQYYEFYVSYS